MANKLKVLKTKRKENYTIMYNGEPILIVYPLSNIVCYIPKNGIVTQQLEYEGFKN